MDRPGGSLTHSLCIRLVPSPDRMSFTTQALVLRGSSCVLCSGLRAHLAAAPERSPLRLLWSTGQQHDERDEGDRGCCLMRIVWNMKQCALGNRIRGLGPKPVATAHIHT